MRRKYFARLFRASVVARAPENSVLGIRLIRAALHAGKRVGFSAQGAGAN